MPYRIMILGFTIQVSFEYQKYFQEIACTTLYHSDL